MLQKVIIQNQFLQILNISGNSIKNDGLKLILQGFRQSSHKTLTSLDISYNEINHYANEIIHDLIVESNLLKISLKGNHLGNESAEKISHALFFSRSKVTHLNLADIGLTSPGMVHIFDAVKHNFQL